MAQHPFEEARERGSRGLSRRELLAAGGGVVLAGSLGRPRRLGLRGERGQAQARRHVPPRRHGRRREGLHRRPVDHHQARPGAPDRPAGRRCSPTTRNYKLGDRRPGRGGHPGQRQRSGRSGSRTGSSSTTARRSSADDVIYSIQRIARTRRTSCSAARASPRSIPTGIKKMDKLTVRMKLKTAGLRRSPSSSASTTTASCPSATRAPTSSSGSAPGRSSRRASRPGRQSVHDAQPELLAHRPAVLRSGHRSSTSRDPSAQVNALFSGADRRDDRTSRSRSSRRPRATATSRSSSRQAAAGCRSAWRSTCRRSTTSTCARRCG